MGAIVLLFGVIGLGAIIGAVVVLAVLRSRRNSRTGPIGTSTPPYAQNMGCQPQQPYPPAPHQGYSPTPAQSPQYHNPYTQQPPHHGQ